MADEAFDPGLHITAGELRAGGYQIAPDVPDAAWVPRAHITVGIVRTEDGTPMHPGYEFRAKFHSPFRVPRKPEPATDARASVEEASDE